MCRREASARYHLYLPRSVRTVQCARRIILYNKNWSVESCVTVGAVSVKSCVVCLWAARGPRASLKVSGSLASGVWRALRSAVDFSSGVWALPYRVGVVSGV